MSDDLHHLAGAYALDALTSDERRSYEAHYPTCEICRNEVAEFRATAARLAEGTATAPPADLKERVMAQIAATPQMPPAADEHSDELARRRRSRARRAMVLVAAAAVVVFLVATVAVVRSSSDPTTVDELIAAPDAVITELEGDGGAVTVVWSASEERVAVVASGLADPGPEQTYELWMVVEDGVVPAGLFVPSDGAVGQVIEVDDNRPGGWGITIEPATGSDQPTGEILFTGTI